ncbi:hypothetical protein ACQP3F_34440, partial [Escherichia coli]
MNYLTFLLRQARVLGLVSVPVSCLVITFSLFLSIGSGFPPQTSLGKCSMFFSLINLDIELFL